MAPCISLVVLRIGAQSPVGFAGPMVRCLPGPDARPFLDVEWQRFFGAGILGVLGGARRPGRPPCSRSSRIRWNSQVNYRKVK